MKHALPTITGILALLNLTFCIDLLLYELTPWAGVLSFIDLTPYVILISGIIAVVLGVVTVLILKKNRKSEPSRNGSFTSQSGGGSVRRILPMISGTIGVYGLIRLLLPGQTLRIIVTTKRFMGLSIENIYTVHLVFTVVFLVITVILFIFNLIRKRRNNTKEKQALL